MDTAPEQDDAAAAPAAADAPAAPAARPRLTGASIACIVLAGIALIASFSQPTSLVAVALFGGYAYHLYRGGRDFTGVMADGRPRARAWMAWASIASLALIVGFTWTPALLIAAATGGYAAYLFSGRRDVVRQGRDGRDRSAVWLYYAVIAVLGVVLGFSHAAAFVPGGLAAAYSAYLYRGGRWVVWIW